MLIGQTEVRIIKKRETPYTPDNCSEQTILLGAVGKSAIKQERVAIRRLGGKIETCSAESTPGSVVIQSIILEWYPRAILRWSG